MLRGPTLAGMQLAHADDPCDSQSSEIALIRADSRHIIRIRIRPQLDLTWRLWRSHTHSSRRLLFAAPCREHGCVHVADDYASVVLVGYGRQVENSQGLYQGSSRAGTRGLGSICCLYRDRIRSWRCRLRLRGAGLAMEGQIRHPVMVMAYPLRRGPIETR